MNEQMLIFKKGQPQPGPACFKSGDAAEGHAGEDSSDGRPTDFGSLLGFC